MGCAVVGITTADFRSFAETLLNQRNAGSLPLVVVGHPVGGITRERAAELVSEQVVEAVVAALQKEPSS